MSVWSAPITWANGAVTATQMNSLRDNLNYLKGVVAGMTNNTDADTGTGMRFGLTKAAATDIAYASKVSGESFERFQINAEGDLRWGNGTAAVDTFLQRSATGELTLSGSTASGLHLNFLHTTDVGYIDMTERAAGNPGAPGTNQARIFCKDNGSGKTQLCVIWGSGVVTTMFTQP